MFGIIGFPGVCDYSGVFQCFISAGIRYLGLLLQFGELLLRLPLFNMWRKAVAMKVKVDITRLKNKSKPLETSVKP